MLRQLDQVLRLQPVVELARQALLELLDQADELVAAPDLGVGVEQGGGLVQRRQVLRDRLVDAGPLHLDHHRRPSRRAARWTWPSEAAASGVGSNSEKALEMRTPSSASTIASTSANGNGSTSSCRRASASRYDDRQQVGAGGEHLAELDEGRAEGLEIAANSAAGSVAWPRPRTRPADELVGFRGSPRPCLAGRGGRGRA